MTDRFIDQFLAARLRSVPIIAVETPDMAATTSRVVGKSSPKTPMFLWDGIRGLQALNQPARSALPGIMGGGDPATVTLDPTGMLAEFAPKLPELAVLFCLNVHRFLNDATASGANYVQAVWNLRDPYKSDTRTLVLLGPQFTLPSELIGDVLLLAEPLPGDAEIEGIVAKLEQSGLKVKPAERPRAVDAVRGLAAFSAEQALAMAVTDDNGLDFETLWDRKRRMIEATPGLAVWRGAERFSDVGGNEQVKRYLSALQRGRDPFRVVVFFDEIEKQLAGAMGDTSGVSGAQHGQLLTYMQDKNVQGVRFIGPPGAGKTAVAKAIGGEAGVLTIAVDLGTMKGSLVGQSEARLATALKVIDAVGNGAALFVATCNRDVALSPEIRRRFSQVFYFDLPDRSEKAAIWTIYRRKYDLGDEAQNPAPNDDGWTGAEIRQAALLAYRLQIPLADTAQYIVPVSKAAPEELAALRRQANGRYLSASRPGVYTVADPDAAITKAVSGRRLTRKEV